MEEHEIDVDGHGKRPPRVGLHEPRHFVNFFQTNPSLCRTYHWKMKDCAWHSADSLPRFSPSYLIMDATLAPALAMAAQKRNRFGVVRNFLKQRYETMIRAMATMERPAPVRSIRTRTFISPAVRPPAPGCGGVSWGPEPMVVIRIPEDVDG